MNQENLNKMLKISKMICILIFQIFFFGSILLLVLFKPKEKIYGFLTISIWVLAAIPYIKHDYFVHFFIKKFKKNLRGNSCK